MPRNPSLSLLHQQSAHQNPVGSARIETSTQPTCEGAVQNGRGDWYWLYAKEEALPKRRASERQLEALVKAREAQDIARRTCRSCNKLQVSIDNLDKHQVCGDCNYEIAKAEWEAEQAWIEADGEAAAEWALALLNRSDWVVLDTETTGLDNAEVCQIAIVTPDGTPLVNTLVKPSVPIPNEVTAIHGITDEMVAPSPTFPEIHDRIQQAIADKQVIVFNAAFDRGILRYCCQLHGLPILSCKKWICAMLHYAQWCGEWSDYHQNYRWQPLYGNHEALGDCQRVLEIIRTMAGLK